MKRMVMLTMDGLFKPAPKIVFYIYITYNQLMETDPSCEW